MSIFAWILWAGSILSPDPPQLYTYLDGTDVIGSIEARFPDGRVAFRPCVPNNIIILVRATDVEPTKRSCATEPGYLGHAARKGSCLSG